MCLVRSPSTSSSRSTTRSARWPTSREAQRRSSDTQSPRRSNQICLCPGALSAAASSSFVSSRDATMSGRALPPPWRANEDGKAPASLAAEHGRQRGICHDLSPVLPLADGDGRHSAPFSPPEEALERDRGGPLGWSAPWPLTAMGRTRGRSPARRLGHSLPSNRRVPARGQRGVPPCSSGAASANEGGKTPVGRDQNHANRASMRY